MGLTKFNDRKKSIREIYFRLGWYVDMTYEKTGVVVCRCFDSEYFFNSDMIPLLTAENCFCFSSLKTILFTCKFMMYELSGREGVF